MVILPEGSGSIYPAAELSCSVGMSYEWGEVADCKQEDELMVISYRIPESKRVISVYSLQGGSWVESHRATEDYDFEFSAVDVWLGDYGGTGYPAAFIGYRIDGSGQYLDFDIVQVEAGGTLDVRGMRGVDHGHVGTPGDQPGVVISALYSDTDSNCCPSNMLYQDLDYIKGAWSVTDGTVYPTASAPSWVTAF